MDLVPGAIGVLYVEMGYIGVGMWGWGVGDAERPLSATSTFITY